MCSLHRLFITCAPLILVCLRPAISDAQAPSADTRRMGRFSVAPTTASATGGGDLTYTPGEVTLPRAVANRTVLVGDISSVSNPAQVVGSVVDIPGQASGGHCRPETLDLELIRPGSLLRPGVQVQAIAQAQVWFSDIVDKQTSAQAGYLAFSASMNAQDRAEVIIQDVAINQITDFNAAVDSAHLRYVEREPLPPGRCGRYVITRAAVTSVSHRILRTREVKAEIAAVFSIGGRRYFSHEKMTNDLLLSVQLQPLRYGVSNESVPAPTAIPITP